MLDHEDGESQAVVSLYDAWDASQFLIAYSLLVGLRAHVWQSSEPLWDAGIKY